MEKVLNIDDGGSARRRECRVIPVGHDHRGPVEIGGDAPVSVQSMIKRRPDEVGDIILDCHRLQDAGCELIRLTVPDENAAGKLPEILKEINVPLIADIHFNPRVAIASVVAGVDKIRLNPGNIAREGDIGEIAKVCMDHGVPIRVGVNSGSIPKDLMESHGGNRVTACVEGALRHIDILRNTGFEEIVVAIKSSHTLEMIQSNRLLAEKCDLPIHLGVTEAGCSWEGNIRSAVGIGTLLAEGIGDTIRVSLTDDVVEEVRAGFEILGSLGLRELGITFVSCPTCGRLEADIRPVVMELKKRLGHLDKPLRVAIMGCPVNGPGEAEGSDIALMGGKDTGVIYVGGEVLRTVGESEMVDEMEKEIMRVYGAKYGAVN